MYFEPANQTWFLFTNHVGVDARGEYTDGVWVYWSKDPNRWDVQAKAVVLDHRNCTWSPDCIGMPTVIRVSDRLALLYDGPGGKSVSHVRRSIGLAWLTLPLVPPRANSAAVECPSRKLTVPRTVHEQSAQHYLAVLLRAVAGRGRRRTWSNRCGTTDSCSGSMPKPFDGWDRRQGTRAAVGSRGSTASS